MPMDEDDNQKRRPGRPSYRTFHAKIGFYISASLHQAMKEFSFERHVGLETCYSEAIVHLAKAREMEAVLYLATPLRPFSSKVMVTMEPDLAAVARSIGRQDHHSLSDVFQTAVRLYLANLARLPP